MFILKAYSVIGSTVFFLVVHCTFGTSTVLANGNPIWRRSVQGEPLYAVVSLNPWLTSGKNTLTLILSDIPSADQRKKGCRYLLSKRNNDTLTHYSEIFWSESNTNNDAIPVRTWHLGLQVDGPWNTSRALPTGSLKKPEIEEAATRAVMNLHSALSSGSLKSALSQLKFGLVQQASAYQIPEKMYVEGTIQVMRKIMSGNGFHVAPLVPSDLEFLYGPGDIVLVQRRGYGRSPVIAMNSTNGELSGDVHWVGGIQGDLILEIRLIPEAGQWQH